MIDVDNIYRAYQNGESIKSLAKRNNVSVSYMYKLLNQEGYKMKNNIEKSQKFGCDSNYFENIDDEHKAYWLGYIYADGYITSDLVRFGISLATKDRGMLELLREDIKATYRICDYISNSGYVANTAYSRLLVSDRIFVSHLVRQGVIPKKTKTLKRPNLCDEMVRHFIRGYFDGDGCFNYSVKSHNYTSGSVEILGTRDVLDFIESVLLREKIIERKYLDLTKKPHGGIMRFRFTRRKDIYNFYKYIYTDSIIFLDRKHNKFNEYIKINNL